MEQQGRHFKLFQGGGGQGILRDNTKFVRAGALVRVLYAYMGSRRAVYAYFIVVCIHNCYMHT